jgi:hypothetical protein
MPAGSAVVRYDGNRGTVWRVKYRDATGKQVMETLGSSRDGPPTAEGEGRGSGMSRPPLLASRWPVPTFPERF